MDSQPRPQPTHAVPVSGGVSILAGTPIRIFASGQLDQIEWHVARRRIARISATKDQREVFRTLRAIGPTLSIVHESAMAPKRETRPYVGRKPLTPHVDGEMIDPFVSVPIAKG